MPRFSFSSLRARLLLLVLLVIIPSLGLILYMAWEERLQGSAQAGESALKIARQAVTEQRRLINEARQLLSELAQQPQVEQLDPMICSAFLADQLKQNPRYSNFGAIGLNGDVICSALPFQAPLNLADREYFKATVASRDFSLGEFQIGRVTGKAGVNFGYPLLDDKGTFRAVLFAALDLAWVNSFMTDPGLPKGSVLNLIDRKGIILARHPEPEKWVGKSMTDIPLVKTILSAKDEGIAEVTGFDGIRRLYGFVPIRVSGQAGAYLGVGIPTELAYADANRALRRNLVLLALVSLLALSAAWFGGDLFILRPVNGLLNAAKRLGTGDLGARTGLLYGRGELDQLARTFDAMAESLERITRRNELILTSAGEGIYGLDHEGKATFINPAGAKILGYEANELIGKAMHAILHHSKPDGTLYPHEECPVHMAFKDGTIHQVADEVFWRKDGTSFPVEYVSAPITEQGQTVGAVVTFKDITERKRAEAEIQRNLQRIRALHEIDKAIISTIDLQSVLNILLEKIDLVLPYAATTVRLFNPYNGLLEPVACRNLDAQEWKIQEWKGGRGLANIVFETKAPAMIRNAQVDPRVRDAEFYRNHKLVSYLGVPLIAKDKTLGVLGFYTKEEHEFSKEEIEFLTTLAGQAAIAIHNAQLYEEMVRANKVKDEFLSVMSHELRTPLSVIMGYAGMIKEGMLGEINPKQEDALRKVLGRAGDQLDMINEIMQTTQLEARAIRAQYDFLDLRHLLDQLGADYEVRADKKDVRLIWDYPAAPILMTTDSAKLKQILQNLINNALKFTDEGTVTVSVRVVEGTSKQLSAVSDQPTQNSKPKTQNSDLAPSVSRLTPQASPRWVEFRVTDTGTGIPKEKHGAIFDKFHQVDSTETRLYGGVGLGLYIVKHFTDLLGGKIGLESEPGKGSTFTVTIPFTS